MSIIKSILDTDLYKLTMQQAVLHQFPKAVVTYSFTCRNKEVKLGFLAEEVNQQIKLLENLKLTKEEKDYINTIRFLKKDYAEFLGNYKFNFSYVTATNQNGDLVLDITGPWVETILFEVPVLAIVSELYFQKTGQNISSLKAEGTRRLNEKILLINQYKLPLVDMGTRRRFSAEWQEFVVKTLSENCPSFIGTSNVFLAMKYHLKPIGTQAHEWFMAMLGLVDNVAEAQKRALYTWLEEYGTDLGIALTDTFTTKAFFQDFGWVLATIFDGMRHDSGDPFKFGYNAIDHYKKLGIDPRTKSLVFSDSLNIPKAIAIFIEFVQKIGVSFGIGTDLTNDLGVKALNIVIKLLVCNGIQTVKISDGTGKTMGNLQLANELSEIYNQNQEN